MESEKGEVKEKLPKKYECKSCGKQYVRLGWAILHNEKNHEGKAKFKLLRW